MNVKQKMHPNKTNKNSKNNSSKKWNLFVDGVQKRRNESRILNERTQAKVHNSKWRRRISMLSSPSSPPVPHPDILYRPPILSFFLHSALLLFSLIFFSHSSCILSHHLSISLRCCCSSSKNFSTFFPCFLQNLTSDHCTRAFSICNLT